MKVKKRSCFLLLVFMFGLVPGPGAAAETASRELEASLALLYAGRPVLFDEIDLERAGAAPLLMAGAVPQSGGESDSGTALGYLIHATKQQRNNLNDACRQLKAAYQEMGKTCELQVLTDHCSAQEAKLNRRIGFLHKLRGDRRKFFTRLWHNVKRTGARVWSAVGPLGRRILRKVGPEAAQIVLSGGSLSGGILRKILIRQARDVGEQELKRLLGRGLERFLFGQASLARAAGVADCSEEELSAAKERLKSDLEGGQAEPEQAEADSKESGEAEFDDSMFAGDGQTCDPDKPWLLQAWENTVLPRLKEEGKGCFSSQAYYSCLEDQQKKGSCPLSAYADCEEVYQQILPADASGTVTIQDNKVYHRDSDNFFEITFPLQGGSVSGYTAVAYVEDKGGGDSCSVSFTYTFSGSFDPDSCVLQGTGTKTLTWEESRKHICVGYPEPYDDRVEPWSMTLNNGRLNISSAPYGFPVSGLYEVVDYLP